MLKTTTIVVGGGHCGLAMSRCLAAQSIDHVVLERGEVAHTWRTQRWDSLKLLTPNWMTRLPGYTYRGDTPDGYLTASETAQLITDYAKETAAPVRANTTVTSVRTVERGYLVQTDQDTWHARAVVSATGASTVARVPALQHGVPARITTLTPTEYRNPSELPDGGVLVVGASASGIQIAEEVHRSGRPATVAVGEHVRMPRTYRGKDILWWMDATGLLDERYDQIPDLLRARALPSMQLVGSPERKTVNLNTLRRIGVRLVGRLAGIRDGVAQFSGSLANVSSLADLKLGRLLDTIDTYREMIENIQNIYLTSLSNKMNSVMKTLTVFTAIFMPLTFIAGIYGMNFDNMPELHFHYGYFYTLGLMVVITIVLWIYFKWKKYL